MGIFNSVNITINPDLSLSEVEDWKLNWGHVSFKKYLEKRIEIEENEIQNKMQKLSDNELSKIDLDKIIKQVVNDVINKYITKYKKNEIIFELETDKNCFGPNIDISKISKNDKNMILNKIIDELKIYNIEFNRPNFSFDENNNYIIMISSRIY